MSEAAVTELSDRIESLDHAAKRALFAERVPKPVFFDTAFNYIDLPMDDLLVSAGQNKKSATAPLVAQVKEVTAAALEGVKKTVIGRERTREATPATPVKGQESEDAQGKQKGWLGGWFGRG